MTGPHTECLKPPHSPVLSLGAWSVSLCGTRRPSQQALASKWPLNVAYLSDKYLVSNCRVSFGWGCPNPPQKKSVLTIGVSPIRSLAWGQFMPVLGQAILTTLILQMVSWWMGKMTTWSFYVFFLFYFNQQEIGRHAASQQGIAHHSVGNYFLL